jgi:uncharacterized lipoprotein YddW (UPF0748 family)
MREFGLAVWSHQITDFGGSDEVKTHADALAQGGFDILIPCVKNPPGAVDFVTDVADVNRDYPDWDPLSVLIDACRERGVKVHPWFCVFTEGEQSRLLRERPDLAARFEGSGRWACACRDEVQEYAFNLYKSLALRYRPAGLHLDYIRTGGICTCEFCKSEMRERGVDIDAVEPRDPAFEVWTEWRVARLTGFVRRLHEFAVSEGLEVSAAVFAGYPDCLRAQAQDWVQWAQEGIVDFLFPMNYTNSLRVAVTRTVTHVALVGGKVPVWEGLGRSSSASQLTTETLLGQVQGVLDAGAQGIVLFHYRSIADDDVKAIGRLSAG